MWLLSPACPSSSRLCGPSLRLPETAPKFFLMFHIRQDSRLCCIPGEGPAYALFEEDAFPSLSLRRSRSVVASTRRSDSFLFLATCYSSRRVSLVPLLGAMAPGDPGTLTTVREREAGWHCSILRHQCDDRHKAVYPESARPHGTRPSRGSHRSLTVMPPLILMAILAACLT